MFDKSLKLVHASIAMLVTLKIIMLFFLFHGIQPHPPVTLPFAGMGPFLAAAIALLIGSALVNPLESWFGRFASLVALIIALVTFGPQKYFDPQWPLIWPAVLVAQAAIVTLFWQIGLGLFASGQEKAAKHAGEKQCA